MNPVWEGLLLVDKPTGPTSHDVVSWVRRSTGQRRVGHAGTLDPPASGLLPLVLGRATRLVRFLPASPKRYEGTFRLGLRTTTDDLAGEVVDTFSGSLPDRSRVADEANNGAGRVFQVPPAVSARKLGGQRMYRLARRGIEVDAPAVEVEIRFFRVDVTENPATYRFETEVSTGTYVRSIVRDLGTVLGCGAALASLRRTGIGPMRIDPRLCPSGELRPDRPPDRAALVPLDRMPLATTDLRLERDEFADRFRHGAAVPLLTPGPEDRPMRVLAPDGRFLGIGEFSEGRLVARVVLSDPA